MTRLIALMLLSLQPSAPPAVTIAPILPDDSKPFYRAHGAPMCVDWRAARDGKVKDSEIRFGIYRSWALGYVTGFNVVGPDQTGNLLGGSPREELYAAIDGYCRRNPSHSVEDSMYPIAAAYIRRRQSGPAPAIDPVGNTKRATADAAIPCSDWVQDRRNAIVRLADVSVIRGYLTAYNRWGPEPTGDAIGAEDKALIEKGVDAWCGQQPSGLIIGAVPVVVAYVERERAAGRMLPGGKKPKDVFGRER